MRQLVQAHAYWRLKGLAVDLVIWNEDHAGYRQVLQEQIMGLIAAGVEAHVVDRPGGIFVRRGDQISDEDRILLQTVARAVISDDSGTLAEQVKRHPLSELRIPRLAPRPGPRTAPPPAPVAAPALASDLILGNGLGGFSADGREYVIASAAERGTPAPWVNVIANPNFGTVISESGCAYTWSENAHEFRLTPWNNDPVTRRQRRSVLPARRGERAFLVADAAAGRGAAPYVTRHGFGYSVFEHDEDGIHSELCVYVALDAAVKFAVLKVRNDSGRARQLSATGYVEWVLGDLRAKSSMHVVTEVDPEHRRTVRAQCLQHRIRRPHRLLRRRRHGAHASAATAPSSSAATARCRIRRRWSTCGCRARPAPALDPCAAIQVPFELADGQEREIVFMLGVAGRRSADASSLVRRFRGSAAAHEALDGGAPALAAGRSARCRSRRPIRRSTCWPTAG